MFRRSPRDVAMNEGLDHVLDSQTFMFIAFWGTFFLGVFFAVCYSFYDRAAFFKNIGNFFIQFSFTKRSKSILLSYAVICFTVCVLGLFVLMTAR